MIQTLNLRINVRWGLQPTTKRKKFSSTDACIKRTSQTNPKHGLNGLIAYLGVRSVGQAEAEPPDLGAQQPAAGTALTTEARPTTHRDHEETNSQGQATTPKDSRQNHVSSNKDPRVKTIGIRPDNNRTRMLHPATTPVETIRVQPHHLATTTTNKETLAHTSRDRETTHPAQQP